MAMIKCPECGNMVSDKAQSCIHCGLPLNVSKTVKIKILWFATGMMNQKACEAQVIVNNKTLWKGFSGQVSSFDVDSSATRICIKILQAYTGHIPFYKDFIISGEVDPGKKYEIKNARASLVFGDPTKSDWVISEVDVIDSGN